MTPCSMAQSVMASTAAWSTRASSPSKTGRRIQPIPSADTCTLAVQPFDAALQAALEPSPDYDVARWLYVPNTYADYRYLLGTRGRRPLICARSTVSR